MVLIREIEAVVSGRAGRAIEKPEALLLALHLTASVVVDDVEQHGHTMEVEELNYCFELVSRGGQLGFRERRQTKTAAQPVDQTQVAPQFWARRGTVVHFRRKDIKSLVAETTPAGDFHDRQQ